MSTHTSLNAKTPALGPWAGKVLMTSVCSLCDMITRTCSAVGSDTEKDSSSVSVFFTSGTDGRIPGKLMLRARGQDAISQQRT